MKVWEPQGAAAPRVGGTWGRTWGREAQRGQLKEVGCKAQKRRKGANVPAGPAIHRAL